MTPSRDIANLRKLELLLEEFRKIDQEMQMQKALAFLVVAQAGEEGCSVLEMGKRLGVAQSTASRNAGLISDGTDFKGRPGAGLVSLEEDPTDRRAKVMRLTAKGRRVMKSLNAIMEG